MRSRTFGRLGWDVGEIGYGMWGLAGWTGSDDRETRASLDRAVELGCNFFDTAWAYGDGRSERILGELVAANRDRKLFIATKIPPKNRVWPSKREFTLEDCFPPEYIQDYVHRSLSNLGVETIDLIQFHVWEDHWSNRDEWWRAIESLKQAGKVRALGISVNRWEPENSLSTLETGRVDAVQVIYNIFDQAPSDRLLPLCQRLSIAVIARVPFDEGTLTGTLTKLTRWPEGDWRNTYFTPKNLEQSVDRAEALRPRVPPGMTMPELALRWVLADPRVATVIPGMRKLDHVEQNIAVSDGQTLDAVLLEQLAAHRWDRSPTWWSQ